MKLRKFFSHIESNVAFKCRRSCASFSRFIGGVMANLETGKPVLVELKVGCIFIVIFHGRVSTKKQCQLTICCCYYSQDNFCFSKHLKLFLTPNQKWTTDLILHCCAGMGQIYLNLLVTHPIEPVVVVGCFSKCWLQGFFLFFSCRTRYILQRRCSVFLGYFYC